jgi:hypothetical protein
MPGWAKALLGTLGVVVAITFVVLVIGGVYVVRHKDEWRAKGRQEVAEGKNFGAGTDNQGCLDESIVRYRKEPGFFSANRTNVFMQSCLESSRITPGFCDKLPVGEMMKVVEWREEQCRHYDLENDYSCNHHLFIGVPMFCAEQRREENSQ